MLPFLRILLTAALIFGFVQAARNAGENPRAGDLANAFWLGFCVVVGLLAGLTWAPVLGSSIADPAAGILTNSTFVDRPNRLMQFIRWLERRGHRVLVRWLCFVEGVRCPWMPAHFAIGLRSSRPGSWLELAFAREVYRFNNVDNCVLAHGVLRRHGITPPPHRNTEINLVLTSLELAAKPDAPALPVPESAPLPLKRNPRIRLAHDPDAPAPRTDTPSDSSTGPA